MGSLSLSLALWCVLFVLAKVLSTAHLLSLLLLFCVRWWMGVEHISFYLLLRYIYDVCIIFVLVRFKNDDGRNTGG